MVLLILNDAPVLEDYSTKYIEKVANNLGCLTDESERSPAETTSEISTTKHTIAVCTHLSRIMMS